MFLSAIGRTFLVVPAVININNSDPVTDGFELSLWFIFIFLGDVFAVPFVQWMLEIGIPWNYAFIIFILFFLSTALLHHFFIDKVEGRSQEETVCEHIVSSYNILKTVYSNPKNLLWQIDNILIGNLYYIVLVWFPYYFSKLGFEKQSSTISIMLPLAACFGTIIIGA